MPPPRSYSGLDGSLARPASLGKSLRGRSGMPGERSDSVTGLAVRWNQVNNEVGLITPNNPQSILAMTRT